jgi:protein-S-isoprenylcysteine O-methyltransferase Ste14
VFARRMCTFKISVCLSTSILYGRVSNCEVQYPSRELVPPYTDRLGFLVFGGDGLRWLGVLLFTAGGVLRLWSVLVLGQRFSGLLAIQEGHTLVSDGMDSRIRNPSYLGLLLNMRVWRFVGAPVYRAMRDLGI